jgi:hypothetical protein
MNVWPRSVPPLSAAELEADPEAYFSAASFEYVVIVDLRNGTRIPVSGLSRGSYGGLTPMYLDGAPLIQSFPNEGGSETGALLYEVKPSGEARRVLQAGSNGDSRDPDEPDAWFVALGETVNAPEASEVDAELPRRRLVRAAECAARSLW